MAEWYPPRVPLHFAPRPGTVLLCDYDLGRASRLPGEMTKRRPVIVVSMRWRRRTDPIVIVPLSTSAPVEPDERQVRFAAGTYGFLRQDVDSWAKCEFVSAVSTERLGQPWQSRSRRAPQLRDADVRLVTLAVARATGCGNLIVRV